MTDIPQLLFAPHNDVFHIEDDLPAIDAGTKFPFQDQLSNLVTKPWCSIYGDSLTWVYLDRVL